MKPSLIAILLLLTGNLLAQENIDRIEKLAKEVSTLQYTANGLNYQLDQNKYKISFSKTSFVVYLNNLTASQSYYSQLGSNDTLFLIESIPLSRVSSISLNVIDDLQVYVLHFPSKLIKISQYLNGKQVGSDQQDYVYLFSNANKFEDQFSKLGLLVHLAKEEKNTLPKGKSFKIDTEIRNYLKAEATLENQIEAARKMLGMDIGIYQNIFQQVVKNQEEQLAHYKKTGSEYRILKSRIDSELKNASKSYTNYNSYFIIDTITTAFLKKYTPDDFRGNEYNMIKQIGIDASYRYKWNKEFAQNYGQVQNYDQLKRTLTKQQNHLGAMHAKTYSGGALVRTFMLTFGGIATMMGTYGTLDKKESAFSKSTSKTLLISGASTVATSLLWTGIVRARIGNANRKVERTKREIKAREKTLGTLLDKRTEKINGAPVIHENN